MDENSALQEMATRGDAISIKIMCTMCMEATLKITAEAAEEAAQAAQPFETCRI